LNRCFGGNIALVDGEEPLCPKTGYLQGGVDDISDLVETIAPAFENKAVPWRIDLSKCLDLSVGSATILAAAVLESRLRGREARITLPAFPLEVSAFCESSGLNHYFTGSAYPDPNDPASLSAPIKQLKQTRYDDPGGIISFLRGHIELSDETQGSLRTCINEAIQNVEDHADSRIEAVVGARFLPRPFNMVDIAVVDCGIGFAGSLRRKHPDVLNAKTALERVINDGYSAKTLPSNLGQGISNIRTIVKNQLHGQLLILSEDGIAAVSDYGWQRSKSLSAGLTHLLGDQAAFDDQ
jgi:hypothetical protein